ncbi:MAG: 4Fe-4S dicluster domain-containing protein [Cytophagaceae bacterium]|jgi:heterodisulfide reductase subunit C|nr:4Fe-4S dicluster domain-containing protein [Cytophagaceae bacterium]
MLTDYINKLKEDIRFQEGLTACMNCGVCTAICPAAGYFDYDPRKVCQEVQSGDDERIHSLLNSDTIWMCGQCLSCKTRCPRNNTPGYVIQALRKISQETGAFINSRLGRQQLLLKRVIGHSVLETGYCVHPKLVVPEQHPEQGPVWQWACENGDKLYHHLGSNYYKTGEGGVRLIEKETLDELRSIFDETGATRLFDQIEQASAKKAKEMRLSFSDDNDNEYCSAIMNEKM